jgi:hypothetical protein
MGLYDGDVRIYDGGAVPSRYNVRMIQTSEPIYMLAGGFDADGGHHALRTDYEGRVICAAEVRQYPVPPPGPAYETQFTALAYAVVIGLLIGLVLAHFLWTP